MREAAQAALAAALEGSGGGGGGAAGGGDRGGETLLRHAPGLEPSGEARESMDAAKAAATLLGQARVSGSPEKKQKLGATRAGGGLFPPLFGGPTHEDHQRIPVYDLEATVAPPWAVAMQSGINKLESGQQDIAQAFQDTRQDLRAVIDKVSHLESRQDQQLHRTRDIETRMQDMERELRELRSRSPSLAPGTPPWGGHPPGGGSHHDSWQLVVGGWVDARRVDMEDEVRRWFADVGCAPLLRDIHGPQVRGNTCRVSLVYTEDTDRANRQIQVKLLQCLQARGCASRIDGQAGKVLWVKRNRSPEERATVRALVSLKALVAQHAAPSTFEFDWRGKFWLHGQQVLFHVGATAAKDGALLLLDARGRETGWWVDGPLVAKLLHIELKAVHAHFEVAPSQ